MLSALIIYFIIQMLTFQTCAFSFCSILPQELLVFKRNQRHLTTSNNFFFHTEWNVLIWSNALIWPICLATNLCNSCLSAAIIAPILLLPPNNYNLNQSVVKGGEVWNLGKEREREMQPERQTTKSGMTTSMLVSLFLFAVVEITTLQGFSNEKTQHEEKMEYDNIKLTLSLNKITTMIKNHSSPCYNSSGLGYCGV